MSRTRIFCALFAVALALPTAARAGSFLFASASLPNRIAHPSGYNGTGGAVDVEVCIDATAADALLMEIPVQNIILQLNSLTASSPNLVFGANNNIPSGVVDFESLTLHELGHCTGLAHPNLGVQTGVSGANTNFTQSGKGGDGMFDFGTGVDTIRGSSDDQRDDDPNLHWFEKLVNNPFLAVANPQASTYSRNLADLPGGHTFAANADRTVGSSLGVSDTEAVMQQGQGSDEDQRRLMVDDVATYRMAMAGIDRIAGTGDDYFMNLVYGGIKADTSGCDLTIISTTSGFGSCSVFGTAIATDHVAITTGTYRYNSNLTWFFNQVVSCGAGDLAFTAVTHDSKLVHQACVSLTYGPTYQLDATGAVTATAPTVVIDDNTTITGEFTALNP